MSFKTKLEKGRKLVKHVNFVYHRLPESGGEMDGCPFAKDEALSLSKWRSNHHGAGKFLKIR